MVKKCNKCGLHLDTDRFGKRKSAKSGLDSTCKDCRRAYDKERYSDKREELLEQKKEYYRKNSDKIKARSKKYYWENTEKYRDAYNKWQKENTVARRIINERRRTREENSVANLSEKEWNKIKSYFLDSCAYCGVSEKDHLKIRGERLHHEHIVPLSNGGSYTKDNVIPACRSCNSSKGKNDLFDWYRKSGVYDNDRANKIVEYVSKAKHSKV